MLPWNEHQNEGTFGCSHRTKTRNEGTFACSPRTKTGTRAHSPKPPFYETALLSPANQIEKTRFLVRQIFNGWLLNFKLVSVGILSGSKGQCPVVETPHLPYQNRGPSPRALCHRGRGRRQCERSTPSCWDQHGCTRRRSCHRFQAHPRSLSTSLCARAHTHTQGQPASVTQCESLCDFEPRIWLEIITSRDAESACF